MRASIALIACASAFLGCHPDEFIAPAAGGVDARAIDARPLDAAQVPADAAATDATSATDAAAIDATTIDAMPPTYTHDIDIQPVWTANCVSASCHVFMTDAYDNIVDVPSSQVPSMPFIKPGSPEMSYIMHKLEGTHLGVGGSGQAMPPGGPLKANVLDMLRVWIQEGAPR